VIILAIARVLLFKSNEKKPSESTRLSGSTSTQSTSTGNTAASESQPVSADVRLTKDEVSKHSSADSCWTIINGVVYEITSYVSQHPGGTEILRACGIDGTSLFMQRETSSGESIGSGTPHSSSAQSQLEQFKLGNLEQ